MTTKDTLAECIVYVIDDDAAVRDSLSFLLSSIGIASTIFRSTEDFLRSERADIPSCLILDVRLPGMSGMEFQEKMEEFGISIPVIFISGHADVLMSVQAMKAGAIEFLCKPFREEHLLNAVRSAIKVDIDRRHTAAFLSVIRQCYEQLTPREKQVLWLVVSGKMNKQIAHELGLSEITVKVHRASIMRKMDAKSLVDLVRKADAIKPETIT